MFSTKHFSWKKWLVLTLFMFLFTFGLAWFFHMTGESHETLLTIQSFFRRFVTALIVGLCISFIDTQPKP